MENKKKNSLGRIDTSLQAITDLAGLTASSVYGVVGLISKKKFSNHLNEFLKRENFSDGVSVRRVKGDFQVSLYLVASKDVKIAEVVYEVQKQVGYVLKKNFSFLFSCVNVFIQAIR